MEQWGRCCGLLWSGADEVNRFLQVGDRTRPADLASVSLPRPGPKLAGGLFLVVMAPSCVYGSLAWFSLLRSSAGRPLSLGMAALVLGKLAAGVLLGLVGLFLLLTLVAFALRWLVPAEARRTSDETLELRTWRESLHLRRTRVSVNAHGFEGLQTSRAQTGRHDVWLVHNSGTAVYLGECDQPQVPALREDLGRLLRGPGV